MKKMTFNHWDVLQLTYSENVRGHYPAAHSFESKMLKALIKAGWVEINLTERVAVTEEGKQAAREQIAELYE